MPDKEVGKCNFTGLLHTKTDKCLNFKAAAPAQPVPPIYCCSCWETGYYVQGCTCPHHSEKLSSPAPVLTPSDYLDIVRQPPLNKPPAPVLTQPSDEPKVGKPCPTCGREVRPEFGPGDYSCAACGFGMLEPCEHWKAMLAQKPEDKPAEAKGPVLPVPPDERKIAERAYINSAFDYERDPIGSRDWTLFWKGWLNCLVRASSSAVAGRTQGDLERENKELRGWKESAISVMPDYQAIGAELGVRLGDSVHDKILPGIKALKAELAALHESAREAPSELIKYLVHGDACGGYTGDGLTGVAWIKSQHKWRDCTCGLAKLLREASPEAPDVSKEK